jgi:hypothetical protein
MKIPGALSNVLLVGLSSPLSTIGHSSSESEEFTFGMHVAEKNPQDDCQLFRVIFFDVV